MKKIISDLVEKRIPFVVIQTKSLGAYGTAYHLPGLQLKINY